MFNLYYNNIRQKNTIKKFYGSKYNEINKVVD